MDKDMPADWAIERAYNEAYGQGDEDQGYRADHMLSMATGRAFARYIEAHEQPPVDPDLVTAREICATLCATRGYDGWAMDYRAKVNDDSSEVQFALAKLKEARGK